MKLCNIYWFLFALKLCNFRGFVTIFIFLLCAISQFPIFVKRIGFFHFMVDVFQS